MKLDVTAGTLGTHLRIGGPLRQLSFSTETVASADDLHRLTIAAGGGQFAFSNTGGEIIRFSGNGDVGIGTTNPTSRLSLYSSAGNTTYLEIAGNGNTLGSTSAVIGQKSDNDAIFYNRYAGNLIFGTNNTEQVRINSSGYVGIGTTNPSATLDIVGGT